MRASAVGSRFWEDEGWAQPLWPYLILLRSVVSGSISVPEFEVLFLSRYKHDPELWSPPVFDVLETVFGAFDEFVEDAALRSEVRGLGPDEVLEAARAAISRLDYLRSQEAQASDG